MSEKETPHRIRYNSSIKKVTNKKGEDLYIPATDYITVTRSHTKRYRNCLYLLMGIDGCPRKLIDYLVDNMSDNNTVGNNSMTRMGFINACKKSGIEPYSQSTVKEAFGVLTDVEFLLPRQRGFYTVNPKFFFDGDEAERVKMIRLTLEFAAGTATGMTITKKGK